MKTMNESSQPVKDKDNPIVVGNSTVVIDNRKGYDYLPASYRPSEPYYTPPMHRSKGV